MTMTTLTATTAHLDAAHCERADSEILDTLLLVTPADALPRIEDGAVHVTLTTAREGWEVRATGRPATADEREQATRRLALSTGYHSARGIVAAVSQGRHSSPDELWLSAMSGLRRRPQVTGEQHLTWHTLGLHVTADCPERAAWLETEEGNRGRPTPIITAARAAAMAREITELAGRGDAGGRALLTLLTLPQVPQWERRPADPAALACLERVLPPHVLEQLDPAAGRNLGVLSELVQTINPTRVFPRWIMPSAIDTINSSWAPGTVR